MNEWNKNDIKKKVYPARRSESVTSMKGKSIVHQNNITFVVGKFNLLFLHDVYDRSKDNEDHEKEKALFMNEK